MPRARLKAVGPADHPRAKVPQTVLAATEANDRESELVAMRRRIARAIDDADTSPRDLAALTRRLTEVSKELELLRQQQQEEAEDAARLTDTPIAEASL